MGAPRTCLLWPKLSEALASDIKGAEVTWMDLAKELAELEA